MTLRKALEISLENSGFEFHYRKDQSTHFFIEEGEALIKAFSFSWGPKSGQELVGMVHVTAKNLFPASLHAIDSSNFCQYNQILCNIQSFAREDVPIASKGDPSFSKDILNDEHQLNVLQVVLKKCISILAEIKDEESLISIIKRRPRYSYAHKFLKKWLFAVWEGSISPFDEIELLRRDKAIVQFNNEVRNLGDYGSIEYIPGLIPEIK